MKIEFDPHKSQLNEEKHGVPLSFASELIWEEAITFVDNRFDYGEQREIALLPYEDTLYHLTFVDNEAHYRVISLRPATNREIEFYVSNY